MRDFGAGFVTSGDTRLRAARVSKQADSEQVWKDICCDAIGCRFHGSLNGGQFSAENSNCQNTAGG